MIGTQASRNIRAKLHIFSNVIIMLQVKYIKKISK